MGVYINPRVMGFVLWMDRQSIKEVIMYHTIELLTLDAYLKGEACLLERNYFIWKQRQNKP